MVSVEMQQQCVVEWKVASSRMEVKFERELCIFVSAYGPRSEREREREWKDVDKCLQSLGENGNVVLLQDMNARVEIVIRS